MKIVQRMVINILDILRRIIFLSFIFLNYFVPLPLVIPI